MKKRTALILTLLLPVQIICVRLLAGYPDLIERGYSMGIYPSISTMMRLGLGFLPFSVGDLLYALLLILMFRWALIRIRQGFRNPRRWILEALATLSLVYACFHIFWGFNYYRQPLHQSLEIQNAYTTGELVSLTCYLIQRSNDIHYGLTQDDSIKVSVPYSKDQILRKTPEGYQQLQHIFPELDYDRVSLKRSLYSLPLTYMGFNGYLNPLTNEGQVNTLIVPFRIPTTASHEVGHQLGFAKENEANLLACLATMNHPDAYFRYSGYTFALGYCLGELYRRDPQVMTDLLEEVNMGIRLNYQEAREFWEGYKNPLEPIFIYTYNSFLKANDQPDGMRSYSYVVALLVNLFKERPGLF